MKVGIVGLGRMGGAMAQRLRDRAFDVAGWDIDATARQRFETAGSPVAANARGIAAHSEVVISSITEDRGARRIFAGADGFLDGNVAGKLFIEMSTLQPATGRELASLVGAKGACLIEAPVLGTVPQACAGTLFAMVGGRAEDLDRARPVLAALTRRILHMGPHGAGYAMKLAANVGLGAYIQAIAESLALGMQQGLALDRMLDALGESATACGWLKNKTGVLKGEAAPMTLDIRTLRKDIMSAVATGASAGVPMPLSAGTLASLSAAVEGDYGARDIAELPKFFRESMLQKF